MAYADGPVCFLYDTMTGLLGEQIDIPSFEWQMDVPDAAFTTSANRDFMKDGLSDVELPWGQIPGVDAAGRAAALMPYKRGLAIFWHYPYDDPDVPGTLILAGALGVRRSTRHDVSMPFVSMLGMLEHRYLVHEGRFGKGPGNSSPDAFEWSGLSWRALACEVIRHCTSIKPGGELPIDLPYLGEQGTHRLPDMGGDDETAASSEKTTKTVDKPNGWVKTVTEGDTVTVTDHTEHTTSKQITVKEKYTVWEKVNGVKTRVEKTRDKQKTIRTGRTVTEVKTVTKPKGTRSVERTVTKTVTVHSYDANGKETGARKTTEGPTTTIVSKSDLVKYYDYNVGNHNAADILKAIANSANGPDMQFRPYLAQDGQHIRFRFIAGSDGDIYLNQRTRLSLHWAAGAHSTLENLQVDRMQPLQRVYATGAGTGTGTLTTLAEDLSLCNREDPWPLVETVHSDSAAEDIGALRSQANAVLAANRRPLMQLRGEIDTSDTDGTGRPVHPLGSFWPGELFDLHVTGFPDLPDGTYTVRLMQMSGNESGRVSVLFDVCEDPVT